MICLGVVCLKLLWSFFVFMLARVGVSRWFVFWVFVFIWLCFCVDEFLFILYVVYKVFVIWNMEFLLSRLMILVCSLIGSLEIMVVVRLCESLERSLVFLFLFSLLVSLVMMCVGILFSIDFKFFFVVCEFMSLWMYISILFFFML